jgi:hypothetical protein
VKIAMPYYFTTEIYAGLEQRGGMPLSLPRYERDGIWRGDRTEYDARLWTSFQSNDVAPALGVAVETTGLSWFSGRLTYRRVENTGTSNVSAFASDLGAPTTYDGWRVSQERVGLAMAATAMGVGGIKTGFAYDLYVARMSNIFASIDAYVERRVTVSADYDYYVPTFDGDSIWNFFLSSPMNDLSVRASWDITERCILAGGLRGRVFTSNELEPMGGGNLSARYRWGEGQLGARGALDFAKKAERAGMDVYGERVFETRYVLQARAGVWQWNDAQRPDRNAVSTQYVIGAGYKIMPRSLALAEFEHDINRLSGQRVRVMFWLNLAVTK